MARNNSPKIEPVVTLNGKAAENALDALKKKAKDLRDAMIEASKAGDDTKVRQIDKELKSIENTQRSIRKQTFDYNNVLKNLNTSTIKDLEKSSKALKNEIRQLTPNTEAFIQKTKQLEQVTSRLDQLNGRYRETHSWLSRTGDKFNKYFGLVTAGIASITGMSMALRGASEKAAQMDDIYSDVMKTTGLTRAEVVLLNNEFKKLDTRTSREELNQLARDAGKLGIEGSKNILEFVTAANKINVALKEDLGEGAIIDIGKLAEVFKFTETLGVEKSYLAIGSAINAIGQASSASEGYLVEFAKRSAGAAYQAKLSFQDTIGYASALDQSGHNVELAATAFQTFIMKMFTETSKFAKLTGTDLISFKKLLSEDVNSAILLVLNSIKDSGGFDRMAPIFKELGTDGARAVSVLASMSSNIDLITEAQKLSNVEFAKANSIENEYNTKNNNKQAQLEKARKAFQDQVIILGERLSPVMLQTTNVTTWFVKAVSLLNKEIVLSALVFAGAVVAFKSWNTIVSVGSSLMAGARIVSLLFASAIAYLSGNTTRASIAWKMLNASFSSTAVGAIITAITMLGVGLYKLITYQSELTKAIKQYYKETEMAKKEANEYLEILENSVKGSDEYKEALNKLTEKYGPYIAHLINEQGYLENIDRARRSINEAIEDSIARKIKEQTITDAISKSLDKQADSYEAIVETLMKNSGLSEDLSRRYATSFAESVKEGQNWETLVNNLFKKVKSHFHISPFRQFANEYTSMMAEIETINKRFYQLNDRDIDLIGPPRPSKNPNPNKPATDNNDSVKLTEEELKKIAEAKEKAFKKELELLEQKNAKEASLRKAAFASGFYDQEAYEAVMVALSLNTMLEKINLYRKYGKDVSEIEDSILTVITDNQEKAVKAAKAAIDRIEQLKKEASKKSYNEKTDPSEDKEIDEWKKRQQKMKDAAEEIEKEVRTAKEKRRAELEDLEEVYKSGYLKEEFYLRKKAKINLEYYTKIASDINSIVQAAADLFFAIKDAEFDKLEREKEKELALYGDSADKRAEIENKYEKKKFDLQQKYADMEMAVKIAQAIASGAVAAMQAYAQLGPIAGKIAAGLIGLTTMMSVATIVAQRNAIKSMTFSGSSGSTKKRTVNPGYSSGGFTDKDPDDNTPVGVVHANEWVAPAAMVRANPLLFLNLERQRAAKSYVSTPKGFSSGGFTSPQNVGSTDPALYRELVLLLRHFKDNPLKSYVVLSDIDTQRDLKDRIKETGSL